MSDEDEKNNDNMKFLYGEGSNDDGAGCDNDDIDQTLVDINGSSTFSAW